MRYNIDYVISIMTTVCPGSSDPPEKIYNIIAENQKMRFTPFIDYNDTLF